MKQYHKNFSHFRKEEIWAVVLEMDLKNSNCGFVARAAFFSDLLQGGG